MKQSLLPKHIHVCCIAGIGMSGLASVLVKIGYRVTGSDQRSDFQLSGVSMCDEQSLPLETELLVYSSAMDARHAQLQLARERGLLVMHRMDVVAAILSDKKVLGALGTHGKTSTSSLLANIFCDQTFLVGGKHLNRDNNAEYCQGEYAVIETDESDISFKKIDLDGGVFTSLDPEHLESYDGSFDCMKAEFKNYIQSLPNKEYIFVNADDSNVASLGLDVPTYGLTGDYKLQNIRGNVFDMQMPDGYLMKDIVSGVVGRHFVQNAAGAIALCYKLGIPEEQIRQGVSGFLGADRRLTELGTKNNIIFIDDYAHHPVEIKASLDAIRERYPSRRIVIVCEFHKYTRLRDLWDDFVLALQEAEKVFIMPIYTAGQQPIEGVSVEEFVEASKNFFFAKELNFQSGDVVVGMGAGFSSTYIRDLFASFVV